MQHSLYTKTLSNGIDMLFIDIPGVNSFDFVIAFNSGYRFATIDSIDKYEIPHVLEHLVFDGSKEYPNIDKLQDVFQNAGGAVNGMTTPYHNLFPFHTRISSAKEVIDAALDMVYKPLLTEESFIEEMSVIENELQENMGDLPLNADMYTQQQILADMPISTDTQIGRLPNVQYDDVIQYHKKYYTTKNTTIVIATDLKKLPQKKLETLIQDATKDIPAGKKYEFPIFKVTEGPGTAQFVKIHKTTSDSIASIQFVNKGKTNIKQRASFQLLAIMVGNMKSYSVTYKLRKQGLIYGLNFAYSQSIECYSLDLSIAADNSKFVDVYAYTLEAIRDFIDNGVSKEQFEQAKKDYAHGIQDSLNSASDIMDWYLVDYLMLGIIDTPKDYDKEIKSLRQLDVLALAKKNFIYDRMFSTVFSSKGVRAAASMDLLSKEILAKRKKVTSSLIEQNSISISNRDNRYKAVTGIGTLALLALFVLPFLGVTRQSTIPTYLIDSLYHGVIFASFFFWLIISVAFTSGSQLRKTVTWLFLIMFSAIAFLLFLDLGKASEFFTSSDVAVKVHSVVLCAVLSLLAVGTGSESLYRLIRGRSKKA